MGRPVSFCALVEAVLLYQSWAVGEEEGDGCYSGPVKLLTLAYFRDKVLGNMGRDLHCYPCCLARPC